MAPQVAQWTSGDTPWNAFLASYPYRRAREPLPGPCASSSSTPAAKTSRRSSFANHSSPEPPSALLPRAIAARRLLLGLVAAALVAFAPDITGGHAPYCALPCPLRSPPHSHAHLA